MPRSEPVLPPPDNSPADRQPKWLVVRAGRRGAWWGTGVAGAGTALVVILLISSGALGGTVAPPFKGVAVSVSNGTATLGCGGTATNTVKATWSAKTGLGRMGESAGAKSCGGSLAGVGAYNYGISGGRIALAFPIKVATTGFHRVAVAWTITVTVSQGVSIGGKCPSPKLSSSGDGHLYCQTISESYLTPLIYILDMSNNWTSVYLTGPWGGVFSWTNMYNYTDCYNFKCSYTNGSYGGPNSFSSSGNRTWWFNGTLTKSHQYALGIILQAQAYTAIVGYPKWTASAMVNMATLGNGATLTSIRVT